MKILFVRHASTDWNQRRILQGHQDIPINKKGMEEATKCSKFLKDFEFDAFYSSDLTRCVQTADIIMENHRSVPVTYSDSLREAFGGLLEGKKLYHSSTEVKSLTSLKKLFDHKGEQIWEVQKRVVDKVNLLVNRTQETQNICIIAHGGVIRSFLAYVLQQNLEEVVNTTKIKNCSVTSFNYIEGAWSVEEINRSEFLE